MKRDIKIAERGIRNHNQIIVDNVDLHGHEVETVITKLLELIEINKPRHIDFSKYVTKTERGKNTDKYMRELRVDDRF